MKKRKNIKKNIDQNNKDEIAEYKRRQNNKEQCIISKIKEYHQNNKEKISLKEYYQKNKEKIIKKKRILSNLKNKKILQLEFPFIISN